MPASNFRLRFHLAPNRHLSADGNSVKLPTAGDKTLLLSAYPGPNAVFASTNRLVLTGGPYPSEAAAQDAALRAKYALSRWGIKTRAGIDFGRDKANMVFFKPLKDQHLQQTGNRLLEDVHGVTVYETDPPANFGRSEAKYELGRALQPLLDAFADHYGSGATLTPKQHVAYELFSSSQFEWSPRSRFLMLVMAVEALLEPEPRDEKTLAHVRSIIEATDKADIPRDQKASLLKTMSFFGQDSIGQSYRKLIKRLLGDKKYREMNAKDFFNLCYSMRSDIVHEGALKPDKPEIGSVVGDLDALVDDLLSASIG
jgi:Apea-like HEPN